MSRFVDSNIWLYAYIASGDDQAKHLRARRAIEGHPDPLTISDQVITEVAANLLRKGRLPEVDVMTRLQDMTGRCRVLRVDLAVHTRAHALRLSDPSVCSYWDSLIIAAALESGCSEVWSEDLQAGRVIDGRLTIVNPLA